MQIITCCSALCGQNKTNGAKQSTQIIIPIREIEKMLSKGQTVISPEFM